MDLNEIKNFIPANGEKYIFVENGKAIFVLLSFEDYKRNFKDGSGKENNKERLLSPAVQYEEEKSFPASPQLEKQVENSELTLEDLPF